MDDSFTKREKNIHFSMVTSWYAFKYIIFEAQNNSAVTGEMLVWDIENAPQPVRGNVHYV